MLQVKEKSVANYNSSSVSVISDSNNSVIDTVALQIQPLNLAYDAGRDEVFVIHSETNVVSVISDSPNSTSSPTSTLPDKPEFPTETLYIIVIVAVAAIIAGAVLAIKRRM